MAAAEKLVRMVVEAAVVWHDDRPHYTGHELSVSEQEAQALEENGTARRADKKQRRRR